jgi:hypothetical protein
LHLVLLPPPPSQKTHNRTLLLDSTILKHGRHFYYWNQHLNMSMRFCYLDYHDSGLCCYILIHIENLLRPLQLLYFNLWPNYWFSLILITVRTYLEWLQMQIMQQWVAVLEGNQCHIPTCVGKCREPERGSLTIMSEVWGQTFRIKRPLSSHDRHKYEEIRTGKRVVELGPPEEPPVHSNTIWTNEKFELLINLNGRFSYCKYIAARRPVARRRPRNKPLVMYPSDGTGCRLARRAVPLGVSAGCLSTDAGS